MSSKRSFPLVAVILAVALAAFGAVGCAEKKVTVKTGEQTVCTYGEVVSSTVKEIEVAPEDAGKYQVKTTTVTCDKHTELEKLYAEAQAALKDGDLIGARAKLEAIVAKEATFRAAKVQLDEIVAGRTPAVDTSQPPSGSTDGTGTAGVPDAPVASLAAWVPDAIEGYKAQPAIPDASALTREYLPVTKGAVDVVVVVVEQKADIAAAKKAAVDTIASSYSSARSTAQVEGRTLEFGTYSSFAAVAWNEGSVLVVAEAHVTDGKPAGAKGALTSFAGAIIP